MVIVGDIFAVRSGAGPVILWVIHQPRSRGLDKLAHGREMLIKYGDLLHNGR